MNTFSQANPTELEVYELLKTVIDPEVGINIIDLGLVYQLSYSPEEGIKIVMTFSTPGCPMGDAILSNIREVIAAKFSDIKTGIELVWEPKWTSDCVTPAGKKELGI